MSAPETEQTAFAVGVTVEVIGGNQRIDERGVVYSELEEGGYLQVKFPDAKIYRILEKNLRVYAVGEEMSEANPLFDPVMPGSDTELALKAQRWLEENTSEAESMATVSIALSLAKIAQAFDNPRPVPQYFLGEPGPAPDASGAEFAEPTPEERPYHEAVTAEMERIKTRVEFDKLPDSPLIRDLVDTFAEELARTIVDFRELRFGGAA